MLLPEKGPQVAHRQQGHVRRARLELHGQARRQSRDPRRVEYLLRGATGSARGDIDREIIEIVRDTANGRPAGPPDPLDDGMPGG